MRWAVNDILLQGKWGKCNEIIHSWYVIVVIMVSDKHISWMVLEIKYEESPWLSNWGWNLVDFTYLRRGW